MTPLLYTVLYNYAVYRSSCNVFTFVFRRTVVLLKKTPDASIRCNAPGRVYLPRPNHARAYSLVFTLMFLQSH